MKMKIFISTIVNILFFVGLAYSQFIEEAEYYTQLGLSCYQSANYEEALEHFKKALAIKPESMEIKKAIAATYFQLAAKLYKKNNLIQAKDYFYQSLKYYPLPETYQNLSLVLLKLKKYNETKQIANEGLKFNPKSKELLFVLAECYKEEKNLEKLLDVFKELHKYYPTDLEIALNLGSLYRLNRQAHNAMNLYRELKTKFPKEKRIYYCIAEIQTSGFKYKEARETYQELLKYYPEDIDILFKIAKLYSSEGKYDESRKTYRQILALRPDDIETYRELAKTYEKQKELDKAVDIYNEALGKITNNLILLQELGRVYEEKGSLTMAEVTYKNMLNIAPKQPSPWLRLGLVYEGQGNNASATVCYQQAVEVDSKHPLPYYKLAQQKDKKAEKISLTKLAIEKALKMLSELESGIFMQFSGLKENEDNINFAELLELSEAAQTLKEPEKILKDSLILLIDLRKNDQQVLLSDLKEFLEDHPKSKELLLNIAKIYQEQKEYEISLSYFEKLIKVDSDNKDGHLGLAKSYEELNRNKEAILAYKRVIEIDNEYDEAYEKLIILYKKEDGLDKLIEEWEKKTKIFENPTMKRYLEQQLKNNEPQ